MNTGYGIPLLALTLVLTGSLLAIGRSQGWRCLLLLMTFPVMLFATGWLLMRGYAPVLPALLTAGLLALAGQVFLLLGAGSSGRLALLGAVGGYVSAMIVAGLCVPWFHITGVYSPLLRDLWYAPGAGHLDFTSLSIGAIAIAGAGIIADLAVAVTATMQEVHKTNPQLSARELFSSGMRFGRDVIGTEINTLPFALLGVGMGGLLLVLVTPDVTHWPYTWMDLSNRQSIAVEVTTMAAGTIGLALTIPLTALLVSHHLGRKVLPAQTAGFLVERGRRTRRDYVTMRIASPGMLLVVAALVTVVAFRFAGNTTYHYPSNNRETQTTLIRGNVLSVHTPGDQAKSLEQRRPSEAMQTVVVRASDGRNLTAENAITGSPVNDRIVAPGDRVVMRVQETNSEVYASISEIERDRGFLVLLLGVCVAVVLVSGWMGWRALATLAASLVIIVVFMFVIVRLRAPPLPLTIGCAFTVAAITYGILFGFGRKAAGACLGVVLGLTVAAGAGLLFGRWLELSGRYDSDLMALAFYSSAQAFDFRALLGAAVLIGALGVTMDVSIAVASAVAEVHRANPQIEFRKLLAAGMSVGRKVLVAMFGAIFFASIGLNLGIFLLPWVAPGSLQQILANERVATEVYRLLIGGLAIAWCVPAAALCSAWLACRSGRNASGVAIRRSMVSLGGVLALVIVTSAQAAELPATQAGEGNAVIAEKEGRLTGAFTYQLVVGQFYEWNTDPTSVPGILSELTRRTNIKAAVEFKSVGLDDQQVLRNPLLIMTGNRVFKLSKEEVANLRHYLQQGGFLYADDCGGADQSFRRMIREILPDDELKPIAREHAVFKELYPMQDVPKVVDLYGGPAEALGIARNGRLLVVYTHDTDLPCAWERYPNGTYVHVIEETKREAAFRFGINVILHALRQDLGKPTAATNTVGTASLPVATLLPAESVSSQPMRRQMPNTHITAIAPGTNEVWVGGFSFLPGDDEGMARYDKATGRWSVLMDAEGILSEEINCVAVQGTRVLVGSDTWKWTKGLATFDTATGHWSTLTTENGLPHNRVVAILPDEARLWIACRQGLAVQNRDPTSVTVIEDPVFPKDGPFMIGLIKGGHFVWANHFAGVACFDKQNQRWTDLAKLTPLLPGHAMDMACAGTSAWFLSPVNGRMKLVRFNLENEQFSAWNVPADVPLEKAFSLATDGVELLIGMRDNLGVYALSILDDTQIRHWTPPAVPNDRTLTVARMTFDDGVVWAALWPNGGLWRRDPKTQNWRLIPYRAGSPASHILSLARIGEQLYIGTSGVGLWRYDLKLRNWFNLNLALLQNGSQYSYLGDHDAIKWDTIYVLAPEGKRIWLGTNHGLILHDPDKTPSGFEVIDAKAGIIKGLVVSQGLVWCGGDDGRVRAYDPSAHKWNDELSWTNASPVRALCEWRGSLWAATGKGLYSRTIRDGTWTQAKAHAGLTDLQGLWPTGNELWIASRSALHVLRDAGQPAQEIKQSRAWAPVHGICPLRDATLVATDYGLIVCDSNYTARAFYNHDGGLETPAIGALETDDSYVWLGTLGGGLTRLRSEALWPLPEAKPANAKQETPR